MRTLTLAVLLFACASPQPGPAPENATAGQEVPAQDLASQAEDPDADPDEDAPAAQEATDPTDDRPTLRPPDGQTAPPPAAERGSVAAGDPCLLATDCASGVCEGQGCGDENPGVCAEEIRPCTKDLRPYCGCDGETFSSSGSCPGQRFERPGPC